MEACCLREPNTYIRSSHHRSTRRPVSVFQRLGCPTFSISKKTRPGQFWLSFQRPSGSCLLRSKLDGVGHALVARRAHPAEVVQAAQKVVVPARREVDARHGRIGYFAGAMRAVEPVDQQEFVGARHGVAQRRGPGRVGRARTLAALPAPRSWCEKSRASRPWAARSSSRRRPSVGPAGARRCDARGRQASGSSPGGPEPCR